MSEFNDFRLKIGQRGDKYREYLLRQKYEIAVNRSDSRVARSINWLLEVQNDNGSWSSDSVAATSLVLIAFSTMLKTVGAWDLERKGAECN